MSARTFAVAVVLLCPGASSEAQGIRSDAQIPAMPGAREITAPATEDLQLLTSGTGERIPLAVRSRAERAYEIDAVPEEVFAFYKRQLGSKQATRYDAPEPEHTSLRPGQSTPVAWNATIHEPDQELHESGTVKRPAFIRARRVQWNEGEWIGFARFWRLVKEPNSDVTAVTVDLEDVGLSDDWKTYSPRTRIVVKRVTYLSERESILAAERAQEKETSRRIGTDASALRKSAPDAATLGVPPYPGAKLDARNSASMSLDEDKYFIYLSADPVATVVEFYEQKTGKPAIAYGEAVVIAVEGEGPLPKLGVTIQPNTMYPGPAKTVITIRRGGDDENS